MIHCSHLPRIIACPASARETAIEIESTSPEAETGRRVHAAMAEIVRRDMTDSIPEVQEDDKYLVWNGLHVWKKLREDFRTLAVEEELSDGELIGTPDVVGIREDGELVIIDWKSGYVDRDYADQLKGYLWLANKEFLLVQGSEFIGGRIITVWLQTRDLYDVEPGENNDGIITPKELMTWYEKLQKTLASNTFAPGEHCLFCPGQWTCAARTAMVRQAVAIFGDQATDNLPVSPERLAAAYPAYQVAVAALKRYHDLTKEAVEATGAIILPDGRVLTTEPQERRTIRLRSETLRILKEHFQIADAETLVDAFTSVFAVNKTELEAKIKEVAPKRQGAANIRTVLNALSEAGVVETTETRRLTIRKGQGDVDKK